MVPQDSNRPSSLNTPITIAPAAATTAAVALLTRAGGGTNTAPETKLSPAAMSVAAVAVSSSIGMTVPRHSVAVGSGAVRVTGSRRAAYVAASIVVTAAAVGRASRRGLMAT